jgi:hypothetical protein
MVAQPCSVVTGRAQLRTAPTSPPHPGLWWCPSRKPKGLREGDFCRVTLEHPSEPVSRMTGPVNRPGDGGLSDRARPSTVLERRTTSAGETREVLMLSRVCREVGAGTGVRMGAVAQTLDGDPVRCGPAPAALDSARGSGGRTSPVSKAVSLAQPHNQVGFGNVSCHRSPIPSRDDTA